MTVEIGMDEVLRCGARFTDLRPSWTAFVMHGFRNAGSAEGYLVTILGGTDAGHVTWGPRVLERARDTGLALDAEGNLRTGRRT